MVWRSVEKLKAAMSGVKKKCPFCSGAEIATGAGFADVQGFKAGNNLFIGLETGHHDRPGPDHAFDEHRLATGQDFGAEFRGIDVMTDPDRPADRRGGESRFRRRPG
ncbi:MAG: hypothetical protein JF615_01380 [Asticcacaulis sp.]|nr:hypothetical protein [Asticcacaulis sp.]